MDLFFWGRRHKTQQKADYGVVPDSIDTQAIKDLNSSDRARISVLAHSRGYVTAHQVNESLKDLKIPYEAWAALRKLEQQGLVRCRRGVDDPTKGYLRPDTFAVSKKILKG